MTRKKTSEPFVMLSGALIGSDAWRYMGVNVKRLIDFLMVEHVNHGGKENGRLLAPWNQLVAIGIGRRLISQTVEDAQRRGLLDVRRGIGRAPSLYTLTFLETFDKTPATNRWKTFVEVHQSEPQRCTKVNHKARSGSPRCTTRPVVVHLGEVHEGEHLSRERSYQGGRDILDLSGGGSSPAGPPRPGLDAQLAEVTLAERRAS